VINVDAGQPEPPVAAVIIVDAGVPDAAEQRAAAVALAFMTADSDDDGVPDEADRCPVSKEDRDDFEDEDGCPELDNDQDGIADAVDRCPIEAETFNESQDDDGCPDLAPDADKDGVADAIDRCPLEPETRDGVRDDDGCPEYQQPAQATLVHLLAPKPELSEPLPPVSVEGAPVAAPPPPDGDKDGLDDAIDRCPLTAEDLDGFEDDDGCPELDNDDDAVADANDRCPLEAETINGNRDDDGCPDEVVDVDQDGVGYDDDRCPLEPGNADDGCPHEPLPALALDGFPGKAPPPPSAPTEPTPAPATPAGDFDTDGLPDDVDACPVSAEDRDGFEDEDGCPELDNDQDGIADAADKCPLEAESINGKNDVDGCPDPGAGVVTIEKRAVVIKGTIGFKSGAATLQPTAMPLLQQVASTLKAASTISIEIQGHTDDVGNAAANIKLSKRRAEAIRAVLIKNGVSAARLVANGYGPTRPRASNKTAAGREQNRRVEFLILGEAK
jgi:outer membrane protein OmpA-like peptidoglycan-associated protein